MTSRSARRGFSEVSGARTVGGRLWATVARNPGREWPRRSEVETVGLAISIRAKTGGTSMGHVAAGTLSTRRFENGLVAGVGRPTGGIGRGRTSTAPAFAGARRGVRGARRIRGRDSPPSGACTRFFFFSFLGGPRLQEQVDGAANAVISRAARAEGGAPTRGTARYEVMDDTDSDGLHDKESITAESHRFRFRSLTRPGNRRTTGQTNRR